jgi:hypothetical protein
MTSTRHEFVGVRCVTPRLPTHIHARQRVAAAVYPVPVNSGATDRPMSVDAARRQPAGQLIRVVQNPAMGYVECRGNCQPGITFPLAASAWW